MTKKTVLITGASRGIGRAIFEKLSATNAELVLLASKIESFSSEKVSGTSHNTVYGADFSCLDSVKALSDDITKKFPHIDVLINNHAVYSDTPLEDTSEDIIHHMMTVNVSSIVLFTKRMLPLLKKSTCGQVINVSSISAKKPVGSHAVYSASKAALTAFADAVRQEVNPKGIRVTTLHPYGVNTWNAPKADKLLSAEQVANVVKFIIECDASLQLDDITLSKIQEN